MNASMLRASIVICTPPPVTTASSQARRSKRAPSAFTPLPSIPASTANSSRLPARFLSDFMGVFPTPA